MSKIMQQRLVALMVGALLTFTAISAIGFVAGRLAPDAAVAATLA